MHSELEIAYLPCLINKEFAIIIFLNVSCNNGYKLIIIYKFTFKHYNSMVPNLLKHI